LPTSAGKNARARPFKLAIAVRTNIVHGRPHRARPKAPRQYRQRQKTNTSFHWASFGWVCDNLLRQKNG
jgi:hypothetical protein